MVDFQANMSAQLKRFDSCSVGDPFASLIVLKGKAGSAEAQGQAPFSGADGLALDKALGRLGWGYGSQNTRTWFGVLLPLPAKELRFICETIDPLAIIALDEAARHALIDAFKSGEEGFLADFTPGSETWAYGRHLVSVEGFEDALADETAKQKVWAQLKRCTFPVYT